MEPSLDPLAKLKPHDILLGKYELGRLLGRGTFAKVYHARSLVDNSPVAVKVLNKPSTTSSTTIAPPILREVSAMRRLSHPNILRLHEVMATKSKIYLIMEYASGGDLLSRLSRRQRLPEPTARRYFDQLLSALRYSHARGVAHRDIKPQNLLLDGQGHLKLSDFGLSALREQIHPDGCLHTSCGTPAYAAPEVLRGKGYHGAQADAWSCGVILYVFLAGCLPFDESNLAAMYRKINKREYQFPAWFSGSARRVLTRLLDPNPETRITLNELSENPWLKRSYDIDVQGVGGQCHMVGSAPAMNAFDIISMSSGLDLSGLFGGVEKRFMSTASVERIMERIREAGVKLGYVVERRKGEWGEVLKVEVSEVAAPLMMVEMRVEEEEGFCWGDLKMELKDIVVAWHKEES